jgi:hypothetical protein
MKQRTENCWTRSGLLASADIMGFHIVKAYLSLDLIRVKFNMYRHSRARKRRFHCELSTVK